jgi:hypothetical protein
MVLVPSGPLVDPGSPLVGATVGSIPDEPALPIDPPDVLASPDVLALEPPSPDDPSSGEPVSPGSLIGPHAENNRSMARYRCMQAP